MLKNRINNTLRSRRFWLWVIAIVATYSLLLGVLTPWVVKTQVQKVAHQRMALNVTMDKLRINPFTFSLLIEDFRVVDAADDAVSDKPILGFEKFYGNFQLRSLFRWAWSFRQLHLMGMYGHFERYTEHDSNFSRIAQRWQSSAEAAPEQLDEADKDTGTIPRFFVNDIALQLNRFDVVDRVPKTQFNTSIGPVEIDVDQLTSIPDEVGRQTIRIVIENTGAIEWQGSIALEPLHSQGSVKINGPFLVAASKYSQDQLPVSIRQADLDVALNYDFSVNSAGNAQVILSDIDTYLRDVNIVQRDNQRPVYRLKEFFLGQGKVQWPEQTVAIETIALTEGELWLERYSDGVTSVEKLIAKSQANDESAGATSTNTPSSKSEPAQTESAWIISNTQFALKNWALHFDDQTLQPATNIDLEKINIELQGLSNEANSLVQLNYSARLATGEIRGRGQLAPMSLDQVDINLLIKQLPLSIAQPYVASFANVEVADGSLSMQANVRSASEDYLIKAGIDIDQLKVVENESEKDLLHWQNLSVDDIETFAKRQSVKVGRVIFDQAYADFNIAKDGSTTIDRILVESGTASDIEETSNSDERAATEKVDQDELVEEPTYEIQIGLVEVKDSSGKFADESLPLPFATKVHNLKGTISTIDSSSEAPADIKMAGQVDKYGQLNIDGYVTPFAPKQQSQVKLKFKNVNIPNFSPYSVKFAGRKIKSGRLDLDLDYTIKQAQMSGKNKMVLRDFELGEEVESPDAVNLPLDLAIALLKDSSGKISVDLPVAGDMDDPSFGYGSVMGQAISRLIKNLVSSPFRLLAGLVGGNSEDFGRVYFDAGLSIVNPPERERLDQLAKAMQERPDLVINIEGVYQEKVDKVALQTHQLDASLSTELGEKYSSLSLSSKEMQKALERRYKDLALSPLTKELEQSFVQTTENGKNKLDELAYSQALKQRLVEQQSVSDEALMNLANQRAMVIQDYLQQQSIPLTHLSVGKVQELKKAEGEQVVLELKLTVPK